MTAPQVSVIIPAFDPGSYLSRALASLCSQTYTTWDAIVVDDGSTEDLTWVAQLDPRIKLHQQPNKGLPAARNVGISMTNAPYIAFLDADDMWLPDKLMKQVAELDAHQGIALVSTRFTIVNAAGLYVSPGYEDHHDSYESLLQGCGVCVSTVIVRREALDEVGLFDESLTSAEDWDLWLRVSRTHRISRIDEILAAYRVHSGGMTQNWRRIRTQSRRVLKRHAHPLATVGLRRLDSLASHQAFDSARSARRDKDWLKMASCLTFVACRRPSLLIRSFRG